MSHILVDSNVYYLPLPPETEPEILEPEWPSFTSRLRNAWWRLRLALAEVRGILGARRRRIRHEQYAALFGEAEAAAPSRPRRSSPARVIDFESARVRLRQAVEA
jgi:hypothetical protein